MLMQMTLYYLLLLGVAFSVYWTFYLCSLHQLIYLAISIRLCVCVLCQKIEIVFMGLYFHVSDLVRVIYSFSFQVLGTHHNT